MNFLVTLDLNVSFRLQISFDFNFCSFKDLTSNLNTFVCNFIKADWNFKFILFTSIQSGFVCACISEKNILLTTSVDFAKEIRIGVNCISKLLV